MVPSCNLATFISDRVFNALRAAKEAGAILVIATGRSYTTIPPVLLTGDLFSYASVANGAVVKILPSGQTIFKELTPVEEIIKPVRVLENMGFTFALQTEEVEYYEERRAALATKRLQEHPEKLAGFQAFWPSTQPTTSVLQDPGIWMNR